MSTSNPQLTNGAEAARGAAATGPASTTHQQLAEDEQAAAGIAPVGMRASAGIEPIDDLKADFAQALEAVQSCQPA